MVNMRLVNVMELLVFDIIDEIIEQNNVCNCARCRLDIAAIALNNLPPTYVVTAEGESVKSSMAQHRIDALQMVNRAVKIVQKRPHH